MQRAVQRYAFGITFTTAAAIYGMQLPIVFMFDYLSDMGAMVGVKACVEIA
jgi:hypothetical protein